ncbi:MAG: PmeII family type II restriction endonuclease [Oscillochloridaceae bacterium umkhey_bin13]
MALTDPELEQIVGELLDGFYRRRIQKLDGLQLKDALKRKNPYLFRAVGFQKASDIVEALLQAYMSSSDEGIFGDAFFEPLAQRVSGGAVGGAEGVDVMLEDERRHLAVAIKSGPAVFNAQSKRRQDQEFKALRSRLLKTQKQFDALVGYCYGRKVAAPSGDRIFREASGQVLWQELTGDPDFYVRILRVMQDRPLRHKVDFDQAWAAAVNRFTAAFIQEFCHADGSINWEALLSFNSGARFKNKDT